MNIVRIAVLADIHGNLRALEARSRRSPPSRAGHRRESRRPFIRTAASCRHRRSTHGYGLSADPWKSRSAIADRPVAQMGLSDQAAFGQLTDRHKAWLSSLPATKLLGEQILLCHGTPDNDLEYLLEEVRGAEVGLRSADRIRLNLGLQSTRGTLRAFAHSAHRAKQRRE